MNRETRLGLVLGLVVIIAFGIVLTEVREDTTAAADAAPAAGPTYYRTVEPVLEPVAVRPPRIDEPPIRQRQPEPHTRLAQTPVLEPEPPTPQTDGLRTATIHRQDATPRENPAPSPQPQRIARQVQPRVVTHRVQPNENFYKIAQHYYGPEKGDLWKRIYEANRDAVSDPASLSIGQTLVIPPPPGWTPTPRRTTQVASHSQRPAVREVTLQQLAVETLGERRNGVIRIYTVQPGDNLTKIAREQLRDASPQAVRSIIRANPQIQNPNAIPQGMELKIPNS